jgi:3-deoxy-D-manno-octulosonic-acid transferase
VYFLYSFLMGLAALLTSPYWLIKGLRHNKYLPTLSQRLGFSIPELTKLPTNHPGAIWIHAVSVGEALSGVTLAKRLKDVYPHRPLIISTTTQTGYALAKERMPFADAVIYFPLDWAFCVRRMLDAVKPALVVILETEIWPNFLHEAVHRKIGVLFVSGRISNRSFTRWQSYLGTFGFFLKPLLQSALSGAAFLMQTQQDADRVKSLGAPTDRVFVSGNLKYDQQLPSPTPLAQWLEQECLRRNRRPLIVAGSVVATEEPLALIAFGVVQGDFPKALLVLAPRKPERFTPAAEFIEESHRKFVRRTELAIPSANGTAPNGAQNAIPDDATVLLLDSIGELASLYRLADGVFVGGSLVNSGGHNILEPAAFGKVPVFGPSMENFAAMAARFVESQAAIQVESPEDAGVEMIHLLKDQAKMQRMGSTAKELVETSRGALDRAVAEVSKHLGGASQ